MPDLSPVTRRQCLELLYGTCCHHTLLPTALQAQARFDQASDPVYRGGQANVWKGEHGGQDVAVRVIRTYSNKDVRKVIKVGCSLFVYHTLITTFCAEILQRGCDVEIPSTPQCPGPNRGIDVGESFRNGIGVDAERGYQTICHNASRSKLSQAGQSSIRNLASLDPIAENPTACRCC